MEVYTFIFIGVFIGKSDFTVFFRRGFVYKLLWECGISKVGYWDF